MDSIPATGDENEIDKVRELFHETFKNVDISKKKLSKVVMLKLLTDAAEVEANIVQANAKALDLSDSVQIELNQASVRSPLPSPEPACGQTPVQTHAEAIHTSILVRAAAETEGM